MGRLQESLLLLLLLMRLSLPLPLCRWHQRRRRARGIMLTPRHCRGLRWCVVTLLPLLLRDLGFRV